MGARMKIAMVFPSVDAKDHVGYFSSSLTSHLRKMGQFLYLFSPKPGRKATSEYAFFSSLSYFDPISGLAVDVKREGKFDIVHLHFSAFKFPPTLKFLEIVRAIKRHSKRIIVTMLEVFHPIYDEYLADFQISLAREVDMVVVNHITQKAELMAQGLEEEKVRVIPYGSSSYPQISRRKKFFLGIDVRNLKVLVFFGPTSPNSHLIDVIKGVEIARKEDQDLFLIIMGFVERSLEISYLERIKEIVRKVRWIKFIRMNDDIGKALSLYSLSSAILLPIVDPRGVMRICPYLHMASYSSSPIVFPRTYRYLEVLEEMRRYSYRPGNVEEISEAILDAVSTGKIKELRNFSKKTDWEKVSREYMRLYESLL